ncbi:MAG TPA: acyl carrier protein [Opitutaceae bacterium]|nr:acyl carrier protein [Opitutaceae bacterium]
MSTPSVSPIPRRAPFDPLGKFPEGVKAAYTKYLQTADAAALDTVVLAVVRDYVPKTVVLPTDQPLPDNARLIADLGFDSLAISETVFFLEDLFKVRITNAEIIKVRTVGELRSFVRAKLASLPARKR